MVIGGYYNINLIEGYYNINLLEPAIDVAVEFINLICFHYNPLYHNLLELSTLVLH